MHKTDDMASFKNCQKGLAAPFVIDADFDPITKKYMAVNQIMINHIPNHIKSIKRLWIWIQGCLSL